MVDPDDPGLAAWDLVLARDAPGAAPVRDLAAGPAAGLVPGAVRVAGGAAGGAGGAPVVGVYLAPGQGEYGAARRHEEVMRALEEWLSAAAVRRGAAFLALDTRLDPRSWRCPPTAAAAVAALERCDVVVSVRLHGLVLALARGVPVVAVDPVAGGGKVSAQARAWDWPALVGAEQLCGSPEAGAAALERAWAWCASGQGAAAAAHRAAQAPGAGAGVLSRVVQVVRG